MSAICAKCGAMMLLNLTEEDVLRLSGDNFYCFRCGQQQHFSDSPSRRILAERTIKAEAALSDAEQRIGELTDDLRRAERRVSTYKGLCKRVKK